MFANATVDALRKLDAKQHEEGRIPEAPPIVWVHDYQLMLAANTIRYQTLTDDSIDDSQRTNSIQLVVMLDLKKTNS